MKRLFLIAALAVVPCLAQDRLTAAGAVNRALESHPALEAAERQIAVFEGSRRQAGMARNPTFTFQQENIRSVPIDGVSYWSWTDTFAFLEQPIETGGKRSRRKESAAIDVQRARLRVELLRKRIAGEVKLAYWEAAGRSRVHGQLLQSADNFLLMVDYHRVRVREGAMAEADLLRIQLESERLNLAANNALLEFEQAKIRLFLAMGQTEIPERLAFDGLDLPEAAVEAVADPQQALANRSEMKLSRLEVEAAQAEVRLAQANARPDVGVIAGYKRSAGYNTLLAGVQMDLPLFDRQQGSVSAATARIAALRAELESTAAVVRAEVAVAEKGRRLRRLQIVNSLRPMLKQASESAAIAEAAYREGGADLLRLLDAERLRIETETLYCQALAEYRRSAAELEIAMGLEP